MLLQYAIFVKFRCWKIAKSVNPFRKRVRAAKRRYRFAGEASAPDGGLNCRVRRPRPRGEEPGERASGYGHIAGGYRPPEHRGRLEKCAVPDPLAQRSKGDANPFLYAAGFAGADFSDVAGRQRSGPCEKRSGPAPRSQYRVHVQCGYGKAAVSERGRSSQRQSAVISRKLSGRLRIRC